MPKKPLLIFEGNNLTSGILIPISLHTLAYSYSHKPESLISYFDWNLIIQSSLSIFTNAFGLAPPEEPPYLYSKSILLHSSLFKIKSASLWYKSISSFISILLSGTYSKAPIPIFPINDNLSKPSYSLIPIFFKYLSNNKLPQESGKLSANTPKNPLNVISSGTNTPCFNGRENGEIEKPFLIHSSLYSNAYLFFNLANVPIILPL